MNSALLRDVFAEADDGSAIFGIHIHEMTMSSSDGSMEVLLDHEASLMACLLYTSRFV